MSSSERERSFKQQLRLLGEKYYGNKLYGEHLEYQHELQGLIDTYVENREREADKTITKLIDERDKLESDLDSLTEAVAAYFKTDLGEHSSANSPWYNAFQLLRDNTRSELQSTQQKGGE